MSGEPSDEPTSSSDQNPAEVMDELRERAAAAEENARILVEELWGQIESLTMEMEDLRERAQKSEEQMQAMRAAIKESPDEHIAELKRQNRQATEQIMHLREEAKFQQTRAQKAEKERAELQEILSKLELNRTHSNVNEDQEEEVGADFDSMDQDADDEGEGEGEDTPR